MKKKFLSVLLAVVMLASACSMMIVPVSAATTSTLTKDDTGAYLITSADDMDTFQSEVKSGVFENADVVVKLTTDITLNTTYTYNEEKHGFWGTFDGQGHTIDGLSVSGKFSGLFGTPLPTTATTITIQNVAFTNSKSASANVADYSGLLFGQIQNTVTLNLKNIYVDTTMYTAYTDTVYNHYLNHGGLVGLAGIVTNISNSVINVTTDIADGASFYASGMIAGRALNGYEFNISNSALYGDVKINRGYTYGLWGINGNGDLASASHTGEISNSIVDLTFNNTKDSAKEREIKGKLNTFNLFEGDTAIAADIEGFDATAVEGFTATTGYMVPTTLLATFPQHFLTEATADGAKVEFEGYQTTNLVDNKAKVRLVATLADDYKNYDEVGFEVVAVYEKDGVKTAKSQKVACTKVYSSISEVTGNEAYPASISASSLIGGEGYIFAMVITGVPEGISLQVRTYSVSGETTTYGATEVFTIADIPGGTVGGN